MPTLVGNIADVFAAVATGHGSINSIVQETGLLRAEVIGLLARLMMYGLVRIVPPLTFVLTALGQRM